MTTPLYVLKTERCFLNNVDLFKFFPTSISSGTQASLGTHTDVSLDKKHGALTDLYLLRENPVAEL